MAFRFSKENWLLLTAMICGTSMIFLDGTILPVTLPTIQRELGISQVGLQWIINVFFLAEASFVILGGKLGDIYGIRRMYITGLIVFALASVLGGFANSGFELICSRTIQGLGAAMLGPCISAIIVTGFPADQRGRAIGVNIATSGLFLSAGPFLGGLLTQYISWRWVFFVNIFISALGVLLTLRYVPIIPSKKVRIDFTSLILFVGGLFLITLGLMEGQKFGYTSLTNMSVLLGGFVLMLLFYFHYRKDTSGSPFFDFSLFKNINFFIGNFHAFIMGFLLINPVFWAIFFQKVMLLSPTAAGFWSFLSCVPIIFVAPISGYIYDHFGVKVPTTAGFIMCITGFFLIMLFTTTHQHFWLLFTGLMIFGFGVSPVLTPTGSFILGSAPIQKRGLVSGIFNTMRYVGSTIGIALLGSIYLGSIDDKINEYLKGFEKPLTHKEEAEVREIFSGVRSVSPSGFNVTQIKRKAQEFGYSGLFGISCLSFVLSIGGLVLIYAENVSRKNKGKVPL